MNQWINWTASNDERTRKLTELGLRMRNAKGEDADMIEDIERIDVYNNRAVKVTFADGSYARSVVQPGDVFDLDTGITICLLKRALGREDGHRRYNSLIRKAHRVLDEQQRDAERLRIEKERRHVAEQKLLARAEARRRLAREERIDEQREAHVRAVMQLRAEDAITICEEDAP